MKNPPLRPALLLAAMASLFAACTGDDDVHIRHYFNPQWTSDGKHVIAGYEEYFSASPASGSANLVIRSVDTRAERTLHLPNFSKTDRFWILPGDTIVASVSDALRFYSLDGALRGTYTHSATNISPTRVVFDATGREFLWAGVSAAGRLVVGQATYTNEPWLPTSVTILKDTVISSSLEELVRVSSASFAMRLSDGVVQHCGFTGLQISRFNVLPRKAADIWHTRLHLLDEALRRQLYTTDDSGIVALNLTDKSMRLVIKGTVIGFDISVIAPYMVFETRTGDVWLASRDGQPLSRLAPQHLMPALSPDGKSLAAVGRVNSTFDSLSVTAFSR